MTNEKEQAKQVWNHAVNQPLGLRLRTDEPTVLHDLLIEARAEAGDSALFQFTVQVKGNEVWIVRSRGLPEVKVDGAYSPLEE